MILPSVRRTSKAEAPTNWRIRTDSKSLRDTVCTISGETNSCPFPFAPFLRSHGRRALVLGSLNEQFTRRVTIAVSVKTSQLSPKRPSGDRSEAKARSIRAAPIAFSTTARTSRGRRLSVLSIIPYYTPRCVKPSVQRFRIKGYNINEVMTVLWSSLMEWWNLIFALPFGVGLLLGVGFVLGGLVDVGGADTHADDTSADDPDHSDSLWSHIFHWFGIGMGVPLTLLIPTLMMAWGLAGLTTNHMLAPLLKQPVFYFPISVAAGLGAMILMGRFATFLVRRTGILDETPAPTRHDLIGCTGYAVFEITEHEGTANVRSKTGDIHRIACRTHPGHPTIPAGTELIVVGYNVGYNEDSGSLLVAVCPFALEPAATPLQEPRKSEQTQIGGQTH
ncbi:MAG: hypothetical protein C4337_00015 [Armatimonadota bacterium]